MNLAPTVEMAGVRVGVHGLPAELSGGFRDRYGTFFSQGEAHFELWLELVASQAFPPVREVAYEVREGEERFCYRNFEIVRRGRRLQARIAANSYALDSVLRVVFSEALKAARKGLFLHAAGVGHEGSAQVFFGPSGAGKSTLAHVCRGHPLLSDEIVALTLDAGGPWAFSTPFWGSFGSGPNAGGFPLSRLCALRHRPFAACRPLSKGEALPLFFSCVILYAWRGEAKEWLLDFGDRLLGAIPCEELSFDAGATAAEVLGAFGRVSAV